jgi:hypothetical protein
MYLKPESLIMRRVECTYCGSTGDDIFDAQVYDHTFGIRHCSDHSIDAKRDVRAYLHTVNRVRISDVLNHPVLSGFLELFKSPISIRRTSGLIDGGWTLNMPKWRDETVLGLSEGEWYMPLIQLESGITKNIMISSLLEAGIAACNPRMIGERIPGILVLLQLGIYKADHDAQQLAGEEHRLVESEGVALALVNGEITRIWAGE